MNRDDLYPVIDEVLSERGHPYMNAGSAWLDRDYDAVDLRIHELTEALCDALCKAVGDLTAERDASQLIISDLTAEIERLRAAGGRLAAAVNAVACSGPRDEMAELTAAYIDWEARRG